MSKLRVLSIGYDGSATNRKSKLAARSMNYGSLVDFYCVLAPGRKKEIIKLDSRTIAINYKKFSNLDFISRFVGLLSIYRIGGEIIKKHKINVISVQDPFEFAFVAWFLSKKYKVGLNIQNHGDFFGQTYWRDENIINYFRYYLGKFLIKKADSIRVVSGRIKKSTLEIFNYDETKVINVPVVEKNKKNNIEVKYNLKNEIKDKFIFLTMGRFVKQKNLSLLLNSFSDLIKEKENAHLVIIGKGPLEKELREKADNLRISQYIKFINWTDDVYSYYKTADCYVLPSNYEGWGMVIIEAASCGMPIIMTDVGCANEVIINNKNGIVTPVGDKNRFTKAMIKMMEDEDFRKRMGNNAIKTVENLEINDDSFRLNLYKKSWELALKK